jgi:hypothetical protein
MNDMFGRLISIDDIIVYGVRPMGGGIDMRIARVLSVGDEKCKVHVMAGNDIAWKEGLRARRRGTRLPYEGYATTLHTSSHIMVANGIDANGIRNNLLIDQALYLKEHSNP